MLAHALEQFGGEPAFIRAQRGGIPLGAVRIIDGDESRLAAHGQAHIIRQQVGIDLPAERLNRQPLLIGVGLGDARRLPDPFDRHFVAELTRARLDQATDRRR
ncbi:hypothetical protein PS624_05997 [Pseudomonas fluorescens]|uniref:Uncharacterized protein n=1 Tax=Pseudomonas fluorescens TaxID=294 RepID=A0A5E6Y4U3_PSEFL|nr:hypothetical protein PS624_05997 [Pseudomonas fluorescens]